MVAGIESSVTVELVSVWCR